MLSNNIFGNNKSIHSPTQCTEHQWKMYVSVDGLVFELFLSSGFPDIFFYSFWGPQHQSGDGGGAVTGNGPSQVDLPLLFKGALVLEGGTAHRFVIAFHLSNTIVQF